MFLLLIDNFNKQKNSLIRYFLLFLIIVVSGTRYEVGYDYYNYVNYYSIWLPYNLEPLFIYLVQLEQLITDNYQILFLTFSFLTISVIYYAITKYTKYIKTSFLFYLLIPGLYITSFSTLRQSLAMAFFFLAMYFLLYPKNKFKYVFYSVISVLLHYSAIVPVLIVIIFYKVLKVNYSFFIYAFFIVLSLILLNIDFVEILLSNAPGRYGSYLDMPREIPIYKVFLVNVFMLIIVFFKNKFIKENEDIVLINLLFVGIIILNLFSNFEHVSRLSHYFTIFQIIILSKLIYSSKKQYIKYLLLYITTIFYALILIKALYSDTLETYNPKMTPYKNYFFNNNLYLKNESDF